MKRFPLFLCLLCVPIPVPDLVWPLTVTDARVRNARKPRRNNGGAFVLIQCARQDSNL